MSAQQILLRSCLVVSSVTQPDLIKQISLFSNLFLLFHRMHPDSYFGLYAIVWSIVNSERQFARELIKKNAAHFCTLNSVQPYGLRLRR